MSEFNEAFDFVVAGSGAGSMARRTVYAVSRQQRADP